jgi:hypothetical protein
MDIGRLAILVTALAMLLGSACRNEPTPPRVQIGIAPTR